MMAYMERVTMAFMVYLMIVEVASWVKARLVDPG